MIKINSYGGMKLYEVDSKERLVGKIKVWRTL